MNALRDLCAHPENLALDDRGRTVVLVDRVQLAIAATDAVIDRLVRRLARATGHTEAEIRLSEGLNRWGTSDASQDHPNGAQRAVSGRERGL